MVRTFRKVGDRAQRRRLSRKLRPQLNLRQRPLKRSHLMVVSLLNKPPIELRPVLSPEKSHLSAASISRHFKALVPVGGSSRRMFSPLDPVNRLSLNPSPPTLQTRQFLS